MRILVTGASGQVGVEIVAEIARGGLGEVRALSRAELDITDRPAVLDAVRSFRPDLVLHPAAFTAVDACEREVDRAFAVNARGASHVAEAAHELGAHFVLLSTDYVFDGSLDRPYLEWDPPNPVSVYGRSKLGGEHGVGAGVTIARTSWVCGRAGANMAKTVLRLARSSDAPLRFVDDQRGSPTVAADLARVVVQLGVERRAGIFHVTNEGATSWFGFARAVLELAGEDPNRVEPIITAQLDPARYPAPRPANSVLDNAALRLAGVPLLRSWQEALEELVDQLVCEGT